MKVVIIGGVAGGATAAARLRRLDESAEIVVLERGGYVSYANCGLPYYLGGVIRDRANLLLQTPESFRRRFNVDVRVHNEAVAILREQKQVRVRRAEDGGEYLESYDKLIYAPGAKAVRPPFVGQSARIFTLRTVEDTFAVDDFLRERRPRRALVVGGGFIGLETAENLAERGISVTMESRGMVWVVFGSSLTDGYPTVWVGELLMTMPVSFSSAASASKSRSYSLSLTLGALRL